VIDIEKKNDEAGRRGKGRDVSKLAMLPLPSELAACPRLQQRMHASVLAFLDCTVTAE